MILELTDPTNPEKTQEEVSAFVQEGIASMGIGGVPGPSIIGGYMIAIWTYMIAYYGGSGEAAAQLMHINSHLLRLGPRKEAQLNGHKIH